jgi:hypothetical protein
MHRSVVAAVVQVVLWTLLMTLFARWAERSRAKATEETDANTMCQPPFVLIVGVVGTAVFLAAGVLCVATSPRLSGKVLGIVFCGGFAALGGACVLDYVRVTHRVDPEGISYAKLFGSGGRLSWSDVTRVRYSDSGRWFTLKTSGRTTVRVSSNMTNVATFAKHMLAGVPSERFDEKARALLEGALVGNPPPVWR